MFFKTILIQHIALTNSEILMSSKPVILFHFEYKPFHLKERNKLKAFLMAIFKNENTALERLDYVFCSDTYLLQLNQDYLKHDTFTDIITFPLSSPLFPVVSDIYISIDRVKGNASEFGTTFTQELHRVIFHGALHLCGYTDKSKSDGKLMRDKEDFYLSSYFVSRETL